jgi:hypothetical protein
MALLSDVDSTPRAYRLKAGNAARKVSTDAGTSPWLHAVHLKTAPTERYFVMRELCAHVDNLISAGVPRTRFGI